MPKSTHRLICPVCKGDQVMEFACRFGQVEIYGCRSCGSTLSIPLPPEPPYQPQA